MIPTLKNDRSIYEPKHADELLDAVDAQFKAIRRMELKCRAMRAKRIERENAK